MLEDLKILQSFKLSLQAILLITLIGCQSLKPREGSEVSGQISGETKSTSETATTGPRPTTGTEGAQTAPPVDQNLHIDRIRVGLILGPGAVRAFAHIGVLQEFQRAKIPIHAMVGLELGALVGSIYAHKAQLYDVEWQMLKIKEEDLVKKSLTGSMKTGDLNQIESFIKQVFANSKTEDFKIPFACPSFSLGKKQLYMMNKGTAASMLNYCLPILPTFKSFQGNIAGVTHLGPAVRYLKNKGANYFIFVSVMDQNNFPGFSHYDDPDSLLWSIVLSELENQYNAFHKIIQIPLGTGKLNDFSLRKEYILKGQEIGKKHANEIAAQFGF